MNGPDEGGAGRLQGGPRRAAIDIGTNSIKLLVGEVRADGSVIPHWEASEQTRLGAGLYASGLLDSGAMRRTAEGVGRMAALARVHGAGRPVVVATSAAREAANTDRLRQVILELTGLHVRILTGEEEADWTFAGVTSEARLHQGPLLVVDVGGGSTEFVLGRGRDTTFRSSISLGTVRLMEHLRTADPPGEADWAACREAVTQTLNRAVSSQVRSRLDGSPSASVRLVGVGGTATVLARLERRVDSYDRGRLEGTVIRVNRLRDLRERLWSVSLAERRTQKGMPADRADVMLAGVGIYEGIMVHLGFEALHISLRGLRFGVLVHSGVGEFGRSSS